MNDPTKRRVLDAIMAAGVPGFTRETAALVLLAMERAPVKIEWTGEPPEQRGRPSNPRRRSCGSSSDSSSARS